MASDTVARTSRLVQMFLRGVITDDELLGQLTSVGARSADDQPDAVSDAVRIALAELSEPLRSIAAIALLQLVTSRPANMNRQAAAVALVEFWRLRVGDADWTMNRVDWVAELPESTPGLVDLLDDLRSAVAVTAPERPAVERAYANLISDARTACLSLCRAAEATEDRDLVADATKRLIDAGVPVTDGAWSHALEAGWRLARVALPEQADGGYLAWLAGLATAAGRHGMVDALARNERSHPISWPYMGCADGVLALAELRCGRIDLAERRLAIEKPDRGWSTAGDDAIAIWVRAALASTPEQRLTLLLGLLGEDGRGPDRQLRPVTVAHVTAERWASPLRHGKLPRLQARCWADVAVTARGVGRDDLANHAESVGAIWSHHLDLEPVGHLWDAWALHHITRCLVDDWV